MANDLTTAPSRHISIPKVDREAEHCIRVCMSGSHIERGELVMVNMPSDHARGVLTDRRHDLQATMTLDDRIVSELVTDMLLVWRNSVKANESARDVMKLYRRELKLDPPIPTWAVALACGAIRHGTAPDIDLTFVPSTAAFRRLCDSYVWNTRAEIQAISQILTGKPWKLPLSPDEAKYVGDGLRKLADDMKAKCMGDRPERPPPLTTEALKAIAGAEKWDAIPNAKPRKVKSVGTEARGLTA